MLLLSKKKAGCSCAERAGNSQSFKASQFSLLSADRHYSF